ncbi:hypothetical protein LTR91_020501 [Friedmanniomyces endolithicus]|uniref:Uncharacterized protein n=1 Tax=Friedmanniomyces endolithicus TaxID=329885 RepID=A0AAN6H8Q1_9PEZI|nr:hypothetical protein LTR57_021865 [Friedmanniomyces endolithicus]KAK0931031.1 hypothetical protein LTR29_016471 [Friedmanniomyces endolithicus]KAK0960099.1 hypothetical protein LTR91_020501 [Friedmanniomyces endolithicus]KAK1021544.1 hypothetical protein LTS16_026429 [Friedmanniomyces endolithicus]
MAPAFDEYWVSGITVLDRTNGGRDSVFASPAFEELGFTTYTMTPIPKDWLVRFRKRHPDI